MIEKIERVLTAKRRRYLYRLAAALGLVAVFYGVLSGEGLVIVLGAIGAALNVQAQAFTPAPETSSPPNL